MHNRFSRLLVLASVCIALAMPVFALNPGDRLTEYGRQTWQTESGLPQNTVRALIQTRDGFLWIGTEGGLVRFDGYTFRIFETQNTPELGSNEIESLALDASGALLIQTAERRVRHSSAGFKAGTAHPPDLALPREVKFQDREGALWTGNDNGLTRTQGGIVERFPDSDPLSRDSILALYEDTEGDLWIGTDNNGVTILRDQKFTTFGGQDVKAVLAAPGLWMGTKANGVFELRNGTVFQSPSNASLSSQVILALASDAGGKDLLAGTPDGLNRISAGKTTVWTTADGLPEDFVRSLYVDVDQSIWASTRRGLAHIEFNVHSASPRITTYTQANGLGSDMVGSVLRDAQGTLWVGTLHGLSRFHDGTFTNYTVDDGLSANIITDLFVDHSGQLWVATQGGGLNLYRADSFLRLGPASGLPATVYGIAADNAGHLWLAASGGIVRANRDQLESVARSGKGTVAVASYSTSDGLRVREPSSGGHPTVVTDSSGNIWFAMLRGAAELKATHARTEQPAPPAVIETVSIDEQTFDPSTVNRIPAGRSHLAIQYAALAFSAPQKIKYRYRLQGFDKQWTDAGTRRVAYYTNLPPGEFSFQVVADNGEATWNVQAAAFRFQVAPHYYQTWWFRVLLLLIAGLLGYAAYFFRVRQVQAQYNAVLAERNRIAREIHDTLAQGFIGVSVQLELVARLLSTSVDAAREQLNQTRTLVRGSIADARQSIWELRSQSSENQDLASRLSTMVRQSSEQSGIRMQLDVRGTYRPLGPKLEDELFRIGQESVANVVRHSGATLAKLELAFDAKKVRLTVTDDGCGFSGTVNSTGPDGHFGLKGMRERAKHIHAEIAISGQAGEGTTVRVEAPAP